MRAEATRDTTPTGAVIAASLLVTGLLAAHPVVGQEPREERAGSVTPEWIEEQHRIGYHGSPLTHLDALCHVAWDGMTYNGRRFDETATVEHGCTKNGVYPLRDGIVTRGILMDMPGAGRVRTEDIEAWERRTGITISSGDALFLRTAGSGGYHNSIMPFIRERDVLAPLTVPNGAGAAINPIAVF